MKTVLHNAYMITERTTDIHRGAAFFVALFDAVQVSDTTDDDSSNADGQHNFLFKQGFICIYKNATSPSGDVAEMKIAFAECEGYLFLMM